MTVQRLAPVVFPALDELFGEDELQEDPTTLPDISFLSSLLVSALEVSDLGVLAGLASPIRMPTLAAPPLLLSLAPVTVLPAVMPLPPI